MYLVSLTFTTTFSGQSDVQDLRPARPAAVPGHRGGPGRVRRRSTSPSARGTARVVVDVPGTEPVTVGGQAIDTLVVRSVATLPPGDDHRHPDAHREPRPGLPAVGAGERRSATARPPVGGFNLVVHSEYTATIERLTPG